MPSEIFQGESRNTIYLDTNTIYLNCPANGTEQCVTASFQDLEVLRGHRWRVVRNRVITTISNGTYEVVVPMESVMLGVSRTHAVGHKNKEPFDMRRENLSLFTAKNPNSIVNNGSFAYLLLGNGITAIIDSQDISLVERYVWRCKTVHGRPTILTKYVDNDKPKTCQLPRMILGLISQRGNHIEFANGDRLDCRRRNLRMKYDAPTESGNDTD